MRAISLWQPWASLLITGQKRNETRSWPAPPQARGWLAIHASKGGLTKGEFAETMAQRFYRDLIQEPLPRGAIVGVVFLKDCRPIVACDECDACGWYEGGKTIKTICHKCGGAGGRPDGLRLTEQEAAFGNYGFIGERRFAWICDITYQLTNPIPFNGSQGFFNLPLDVVRKIKEQSTIDFDV